MIRSRHDDGPRLKETRARPLTPDGRSVRANRAPPPFKDNPALAREAALKGWKNRRDRIEARRQRKTPERTSEEAFEGIIEIRDRLMKLAQKLEEKDPRYPALLTQVSELNVRIMDRISGKPHLAKPRESGSPADYQELLKEFAVERDAPDAPPEGETP